MANLEGFKKSFDKRMARNFGEKFKKGRVNRIEYNKYAVSEVSELYQVSTTADNKWVCEYSILCQKRYRQIVEQISITNKVKDLQSLIKELEQAVGQKQMKLDFFEKLIEITDDKFNIDIKKS